MNRAKRFILLHRVADLLVQDEADCGINHVFFLFPTSAQRQSGNSYLLALDSFNESGGETQYGRPMLRLWRSPETSLARTDHE